MSDNYAYFYNSIEGDRVYDADSMTDWLKPFFVTGVFNGQMQVTANDDMSVTVAKGYCNIGGKVKNFLNATTLDLETASGTLDRIDTVVLRRNDTDRDIQLLVVTGGYAANPQPTAPVRSGAYYDLVLAQIRVNHGSVAITQAEITDTRADSSLCGWVVATVTEIDFSQITAQFSAYFATYQAKITQQYATYLALMSNYGDQGYQAYQNMLADFQGYEAVQVQKFTDLYEEMRDLIDDATAAHLQNEIDDINNKIGSAITDLATKLSFTNASREVITGEKFDIANTDTGTTTVYTFAEGEKVHLTEHGNYTITPQNEDLTVIPHTFTLDYTKTTETIEFNVYARNGYAFVGGYVGAYVSSSN